MKHSCEIISKSIHCLRWRSQLKVLLFSGGHLVHPSRLVRAILVEGYPRLKKHSCEIISKSIHWLRRSHLKVFLFLALAAILFIQAERFEQFW